MNMGLVTGYETVKSRAYYFIRFKINDVEFGRAQGLSNPRQALAVVKALHEKGITPELSRSIVYDFTKSGYKTKKTEYEDLTAERLEEIVERDEVLPELQVPKVLSTYRC